MKYALLAQDAYQQKTDCLILGVPEGKTLPKSLAAGLVFRQRLT